ncbi:conserved hypothetical protein [Nitrospira sp. ND1]|mgnify:CR=1 FL=1|jgi:hypothetical protein|uniref:hypothetical protein n=1 Tax=Nitrospira sp. ND1 TaxID=1658518 RepID=UPI0009BB78C8|nr:hypothetical protein [Nitrospira sp. ND1]SLM45452.1 conserved hypothetical protein [Nitrospira sp. ND1]
MQKKQNGSSVIQFLKDYKLSSVYCIYFIAILASFSPVREAHARKDTIETEYESREYKMLLDASRFSKDTDKAAEVYLETQLKPLMSALHKPIAVKGSFFAKKDRSVRFFDTTSCQLKGNGYILRERKDSESSNELVLKFRSHDFLLAARADIARTKLEEDVILSENSHEISRSSFGSSTKRTVDKNTPMQNLKDIYEVYPFLTHSELPNGGELHVVSDLMIHEKLYEGPTVDLGNRRAMFAISLWYVKKSESLVPILVELSFQHDLDRGEDRVENSVLIKAWDIFAKLRQLKWVSKNQSTKTQYVYDYANFCGSG